MTNVESALLAKLEAFRAKVEADRTHQTVVLDKYTLSLHYESSVKATLKIGKKWARVDVGTSGRYMVDMTTGKIVGVKAYGVPNPHWTFGTLDTIDTFYWGGYRAISCTPEQRAKYNGQPEPEVKPEIKTAADGAKWPLIPSASELVRAASGEMVEAGESGKDDAFEF